MSNGNLEEFWFRPLSSTQNEQQYRKRPQIKESQKETENKRSANCYAILALIIVNDRQRALHSALPCSEQNHEPK